MSPETMRGLLTTIRKQNVRTINQYNSLRSAVEDKLTGSEKAAMAFYPLVDMPPEMVETEVDDTDLTTGSTVTVGGTQYIVD